MNYLKINIEKNKLMVRKAAPITIASTSFSKLSSNIERICIKIKSKRSI